MKRGLLLAGLALLASVPVVYGVNNKTTHLTFSHPVQVPGATLPAGTYTFSLLESSGARNVVRITSRAGDKVFAAIQTIADYRPTATQHTVVTFGEHGDCGEGTPIKAWFYPHETRGYRFIYPEEQAAKIAVACNEPVPEAKGTSPTPDNNDVRLVTPSKQEKPYKAQDLAQSDSADQSGFDADNN
jgi:hypothetical protein